MPSAAAVFLVVAAGLLAAGNSLVAQHATAFDIENGGRAFRNTCANYVPFTGGREGDVFALDAFLWRPSVGGQVNAGPMSYFVGGRQYVTIAAGSALFAYALPETL